MNNINKLRKQPPHTIFNQSLKHPNRLLLTNPQRKPLPNLLNRLIRFSANIRDIGIGHESKQVEDEVAGFPQCGVGCEAVLFEGCVVGGLGAAHGVDHYLGELDGWGHRFGVAAEHVAEVDVEEMAWYQR